MKIPRQQQAISFIKEILLIEDNIICQKVKFYFLSQLGYQVDLSTNSTIALININSRAYGLIIQDISLADISGQEIIQAVHKSKLNVTTPVILWSAYINNNNKRKYLDWGADSILTKYYKIEDLEKAIRQYVH